MIRHEISLFTFHDIQSFMMIYIHNTYVAHQNRNECRSMKQTMTLLKMQMSNKTRQQHNTHTHKHTNTRKIHADIYDFSCVRKKIYKKI